MDKFNKLKLDEKLCLAALLIEDMGNGIDYTCNGHNRVFKSSEIGFDNTFEVSRVLYIMSNFIINKSSYNVSPNLETLCENENVKDYLEYFRKNDFLNKLDILIYIFDFLSESDELKKVNFIDTIREGYRFKDLSNDVLKFKQNLCN